MKIVNIQKKKTYSIFEFDNDKSILVDKYIAKNYDINQSVNLKQLLEENKEFSCDFAFNLSLNYLSIADRSVTQVRKYLFDKSIQYEAIDIVLARLAEYGYVDDERYTQNMVSSCTYELKSRKYIKNKLYEKGISVDLSEKYLQEYDDKTESDIIHKLVHKELRTLERFPLKMKKEKIYSKLCTKGFSSSSVMVALSELEENEENDYTDYYNRLIEQKIRKLDIGSLSKDEIIYSLYSKLYSKGVTKESIENYVYNIEE